ncbi:Xaa-Pro dipeptidyl-peptidase [Allokutzneria sp. NRRL B-24872]|uniref:Xaa-Pro dipeptidyl-peptidase n=1 Tax=Allokutzneria sp. NRRL B-24872 TaxID=1137961 RepID=UPI000A3CF589|nr:Xaa-Pro dipeptidyl-peptidase [Allokutzneria sp. NRRL B-24872]
MRRATVLLAALAVFPLTGAYALATTPPQQPVFADGEAQPVFDPADVVRETVFVRVPVDSDRDGKDDEIRAVVVRHRATDQGVKAPVLYRISPYFGGGQRIPTHNVDVELHVPGSTGPDGDLNSGPSPRDIPVHADEPYYLARGYALVYADSLGTGDSTGCPSSGGRSEVLGARSVVDWLNGRTPARDADNKPSIASWTTGKTAMMGLSYNGTLPNAVAATGVQGLEAIVPIAAISTWYDYYRANGAVIAPAPYQGEDADWLATRVNSRADREICKPMLAELTRQQDRVTGDHNRFWDERDYLKNADKVHAATLIAHGLKDWNVKTKQAAQWYSALKANRVPVKIWWHQGDHESPESRRKEEWQKTLNRWFTRYLFDHRNNVEAEPRVTIQREDGAWVNEVDWPTPGSSDVSVRPQQGGALGLTAGTGVEKLTDDATKKLDQLLPANRLLYTTPAAKRAVRISGTAKAELKIAFDRPAANVTVALVDRAPDGTTKVITRGWADPQNRTRLDRTEPVKPGERYSLGFELQPMDYVLAADHSLGLVLLSSDREHTLRPKPGTGLAVSLAQTAVSVPVLGGRGVFEAAFGR